MGAIFEDYDMEKFLKDSEIKAANTKIKEENQVLIDTLKNKETKIKKSDENKETKVKKSDDSSDTYTIINKKALEIFKFLILREKINNFTIDKTVQDVYFSYLNKITLPVDSKENKKLQQLEIINYLPTNDLLDKLNENLEENIEIIEDMFGTLSTSGNTELQKFHDESMKVII